MTINKKSLKTKLEEYISSTEIPILREFASLHKLTLARIAEMKQLEDT